MYVRDLKKIQSDFVAAVLAFFEAYFTRPAFGRTDTLHEWSAAFDDLVRAQARRAVGRVRGAFGRMSQTVKEKGGKAASKQLGVRFTDLGVDVEIGKALDANVALVEKAGRAYAADVRDVVTDPANVGRPWEDIKADLLERGNVSESRAELIARDQTLKLSANIAATRMQAAGVTKYEWSTSRDERVRPTHRALEGTTQSFAAPPVVDPKTGRRCNPGEDYQCRCVAVPVLDELL